MLYAGREGHKCILQTFDPPLIMTPEKVVDDNNSNWPISPLTPQESTTSLDNPTSDFRSLDGEFLSPLRLSALGSVATSPHAEPVTASSLERLATEFAVPSQRQLLSEPSHSIWSTPDAYAPQNKQQMRTSIDNNGHHAHLVNGNWAGSGNTAQQQRSESNLFMTSKTTMRPSAEFDYDNLPPFTYSRPGPSSWSGLPGEEFTPRQRQLSRQPSEGGARLRAEERADRATAAQQVHMFKMMQQQQQQQQQQLTGLGSSAALGIPGQQQQHHRSQHPSFSLSHLQGLLSSQAGGQPSLDDLHMMSNNQCGDDHFSGPGHGLGPGSLPYASGGASLSSAAATGPGLTSALAQLAAERGLDQAALAMLLQNPAVLDLLTAGTAKQQQQQQQQQQMSYAQQYPFSSSGAPQRSSVHSLPPLSSLPPAHRSSDSGRRSGAGNAMGLIGGGNGGSAGPMPASTPPGMTSALPLGFLPAQAQLMAELNSSRGVLVQLMLSAFAFLHSDSMRGFYDSLSPISNIYSSMHELPVVQKRQRCHDMTTLRQLLMQEPGFAQILAAVCSLRHHLHSLSKKVLQLNQQGMDAVPIDLLLGGMSSELFHILKGSLPQEVLDFFSNSLPLPKLAVLVFVEFTAVDVEPIPV